MRVCEQKVKAAPERKLRYNDLKPGDVFRWGGISAAYSFKDAHGGHTYITGKFKGDRWTSSRLTGDNCEVVIYPDACLEPGEATTHTTGS